MPILDTIKSWLGLTPEPPREHSVAPGEYGNLLERATTLSGKLSLLNPPLIIVRESEQANASYRASDDTLRITTGSLKRLNEREVNSELAHELGHDRDRRERPYGVPARDREFRADELAVVATNDPEARISGLKKIEEAAHHDHATMEAKISDKMGPHMARLYGKLPDVMQTVIQEGAFHTKQLLRRLHLARHPLAEERYEKLENFRDHPPRGGQQQER